MTVQEDQQVHPAQPAQTAVPVPPVQSVADVRVVEQQLCELFAEVLGLPDIDPQDSFFDLGGHSLLASRLVRSVSTRYGVKVPLRRFYEAPTAAAVAQHLHTA
ncbi:acyl carrier protein [Streptomyces sp. H27-D2]|uniref:acyl carrier protein n=1 Tax=Streptomyces sp. H27-D2 TaxID=3046304 RepID=UPI002DC0543B|nr:acyl carrier protein [Streptomyces sp. H27-D2]MEC4015470.1 acyl carrier protein [Streptomyces sp. H27-D2]